MRVSGRQMTGTANRRLPVFVNLALQVKDWSARARSAARLYTSTSFFKHQRSVSAPNVMVPAWCQELPFVVGRWFFSGSAVREFMVICRWLMN